jgi:hypothetical protein
VDDTNSHQPRLVPGCAAPAVADRLTGGHVLAPELSPDVVIDGQGREVAVLVGYSHYVSLLGILATQLDRSILPPYWRGAVEECLCLDRRSASAAAAGGRSANSMPPLPTEGLAT